LGYTTHLEFDENSLGHILNWWADKVGAKKQSARGHFKNTDIDIDI
jgi:hypothetical protein